jgi:hypothetical protein
MPEPISKTRPILAGIMVLLCAGIILAVVFHMTGRTPGPESEPVPQTVEPGTPCTDTSAPVKENPAEAPGQFVISASAETGAKIYASRPLILSASLWRKALAPDAQGNLPTDGPIDIKARTVSWQEALAADVRNATGEAVAWPLHPMPASPADQFLSLKADDSVQVFWFLDPFETEALEPGAYTVAVSFDRAKVEGLPEYVAADRVHVTVEKEMPATIPETEKQLEDVRFALFKKDAETAEKTVDQVLSKDPENLDGLSLKAAILAEKGNHPEAVALVNHALMAYYRKFPDADPPLGLIQQRDEYLQEMAPVPVKNEGPLPSN